MQGLSIRIAKGLNGVMGRSGKVFADRYHARILKTPTEVRNALGYVVYNFSKHMAELGKPMPAGWVDEYSSLAPMVIMTLVEESTGPPVIAAPRTWMLRRAVASVLW